jgi:cyclopropane fatty-acyl-phospholipid synthase-like methyltransferase
MLKRIKEASRDLKNLKKFQTEVEDMRVELNQFISLLTIKYELPRIPPKPLQKRVAGAFYANFFKHGEQMFQNMQSLLKDQGLSMQQFQSILDFGCGCGRFLIPLSCLLDPSKISGTDIDAEAVGWLKANYSCFHDLDVNATNPPTKYADGAFDFIFSISIFTHLPEEMQHAWLKELSRIIKPGGYGIFSTHGEKHFSLLKEAAYEQLMKKGFYYSIGENTEGLPDFYQTSFHTHEYIRREWAKYFEVVAIRTKGIGENQDAVLVRSKL